MGGVKGCQPAWTGVRYQKLTHQKPTDGCWSFSCSGCGSVQMLQAEGLNSIVGNAFRMAYAAQLELERRSVTNSPKTNLNNTSWMKLNDKLNVQRIHNGSPLSKKLIETPKPTPPTTLPGVRPFDHDKGLDLTPGQFSTPTSSDDSPDLNTYKRMLEKPPLIKRLAMGLSVHNNCSNEDWYPLVCSSSVSSSPSTNSDDCSTPESSQDKLKDNRLTQCSARSPDSPTNIKLKNNLISNGMDKTPTPPPLPERSDSLLDKPEECELKKAPWFQAGIPREITLEVLGQEPVGAHDNTQLEGMVNRRGEESVSLKNQDFKTQPKSLVPHKNNMSCRRKNTKTEARGEQEREFDSRDVSQVNATEKGRESYSPDELRHLTLKAAQSDAEEGSENERLLPENECTKREKANSKESKSLISSTSNPPWRMDLHALGVSYKIKRLKQQLMMLERYIGKPESQETEKNSSDTGKRALLLLITLLNKQVTRYQSLQEKIDDLCKRMHVNDPQKISGKNRANGEAKTSLEHFLDETFQLQRYIVATGQKLMEIQSKIASGFVEFLVDLITTESSSSSSSFDPERFAENIKSLFQEVQRGLEVRISRCIGDLEGTLAREGMIHLKRRADMELRV